jgi:hypothetical protein
MAEGSGWPNAGERSKEILVAEAGGRCRLCGYDRCVAALQFHQLDPSRKRFSLGHQGFTRGIATMREEARKCILLCANCHSELEAGIVNLDLGTLSEVPQIGSPG